MHKRPFAAPAVFFMFGIFLARNMPGFVEVRHAFIITLVLILASFLSNGQKWISKIFSILSIVSFAFLLYTKSSIFPNNHISHVLGEKKLKAEIIGIIKSPVLKRNPYYGKINSTYLFKLEQVGDRSVTGLAQIKIRSEKDYAYGDRLLVKGTIRNPKSKYQNPKKISNQKSKFQKNHFDYAEYLARQNIFALINVKEKNITVLAHDYKINPILKYIYLFREKLKNRIIEKMPLDTGAFMRAILLGDRSELPKDMQICFKNSGTMHVLAISGLHVGIIAAVLLFIFRIFGVKREISYLCTMMFLVFFSFMTLLRPSVVRAVIMACIIIIGRLLGKRTDIYNSLSAAAVFILVRNPKDFFNVGFQLSFAAVLSIAYLTPRLTRFIKYKPHSYIVKWFYTSLMVSFSAWIGTFPLILYYFNIVTPVSVIANLFILPLIFIVLLIGMLFFPLSYLPFFSSLAVTLNNICINFVFLMADFFSSLRFSHFNL